MNTLFKLTTIASVGELKKSKRKRKKKPLIIKKTMKRKLTLNSKSHSLMKISRTELNYKMFKHSDN
jgi:hypothetical protein